jgi:anti-anti-sigma factor
MAATVLSTRRKERAADGRLTLDLPNREDEPAVTEIIIDQQRDGTVLVIALKGQLDTAAVAAVGEALTRALDAAPAILLDLAELSYINSAGLRVILKTAKQAKSRQLRLAFAAIQPLVQDVFELSGFTNILVIYGDRDAALAQLR